ncbi:MAG TPA: amino acid adenylation domain-containing protein, partial [Blastocatellia bacterium]|nr:amino acid adenylation domain-containing protein [Blastocatellia bacterium]
SYQFSWTEHHAILDGWSAASMITEIVAVYHEIDLTGVVAPISLPTITFRDFISLELDAVQSEECRLFWERKLADCLATLRFREEMTSRKTAARRVLKASETVLEGERFESVKRFAAQAGVPFKSALLAAHFRVQALLSGCAKTVARIVSNGRPEEEGGDRIFGLFLNTLPLALDLSGLTLTGLARSVFEAEQQSLPYRRYPFARIERLTGAKIGIHSLFNFVHFHIVDSVPPDTALEALDLTSAIETDFGLEADFILETSLNRLRQLISCDDNSEFGGESLSTISDYYTRAIDQMITLPDSRIENLSLLSNDEMRQIADCGARVTRRGTTVLDLFTDSVAVRPDCIALWFEDEALTYLALDRLANLTSLHVRSLTADDEPLVAICLDRSIEMAVAVLAVLQAGAAYMPLDPAYPTERLAFMVGDSKAALAIASRATAAGLPTDTLSIVLIEDLLERDSEVLLDAPQRSAPAAPPDSPAYLIYTSGSTGQPKGVVMTHRALFNIISWQLEQLACRFDDCILQFSPLSFDVSIQEIMSAWCGGGTLQLIAEDLRRDPNLLLEFMRERGAARAFLPFIALQQLAEAFEDNGSAPAALREIVTAGEQLRTTPQIRRLLKSLPECRLENQYGPTETHVATSYPLSDDPALWDDLPPIGRPVSNTETYVLNEWLLPSAVGVPGELVIAGDCVARGYLGRPELTAEKFLASPLSPRLGARMYRTGDVALQRPDRHLEFLGRMDRQTKLRGFRIE